ncbi:MAG: hypothetical protein AB8G96_15890 [Phycisphaerales bacterium]
MTLARLATATWWSAIGVWMSSIAAAGIAASFTFPVLKKFQVTIPGWAAPESEHWRYAAGQVMDPIFFLVDLIQFVVAPLSLLALLAMRLTGGRTPHRILGAIRLGALLVATGLFAWQGLGLAQGMRTGLRQQWDAAEAGDMVEAERLRAEFNGDHQLASSLLRFTLLAVVVAGVASAFDLAPAWRGPRAAGGIGGRGHGGGGSSPLETPALAGSRRR